MVTAEIRKFIKCVGVRVTQDTFALPLQHAFDDFPQALVPGSRDQIRS